MFCNICGYDIRKHDTDKTKDQRGHRVHASCLRDSIVGWNKTMEMLKSGG